MVGIWLVPLSEWDRSEFSPDAIHAGGKYGAVHVMDELGPHVGNNVHELQREGSHLIAIFRDIDDAVDFLEARTDWRRDQ
jgi:hypothetical protein